MSQQTDLLFPTTTIHVHDLVHIHTSALTSVHGGFQHVRRAGCAQACTRVHCHNCISALLCTNKVPSSVDIFSHTHTRRYFNIHRHTHTWPTSTARIPASLRECLAGEGTFPQHNNILV